MKDMNQRTAALYGAGNKSLKAEDILRLLAPEISIPYLVEGVDFTKIGLEVPSFSGTRALQVISPATLAELYASGDCDLVIIPNAYHLFDWREIREKLELAGIAAKDIYAMPYNRLAAPTDHTGPGLEPLLPVDDTYFIYHLDIHIVDHCNIRCKACAHFSNCVDEKITYDVETLCKSLEHLQNIMPNIHNIAILGGEPLLHNDLDKIVTITRKLFPYSSISIVTNGLLLKSLSPEIMQIILDNNIHLSLSLHMSILHNKIESIVTFLRDSGVQFSIFNTEFFERRLTPHKIFDAKRQFSKCGHIMCLRGSHIGYCVIALFTDYYNRRFADKGVPPLPEDPGVDIFAHNSGASLLAALHRPLELCAQCVSRDAGRMFFEKWQNGGPTPDPDEWFIKFPFAERDMPSHPFKDK